MLNANDLENYQFNPSSFHPSPTHHLPGLLCSKFLRRGRVKKPGQELFKSTPSEYFTAQDLYVGATICLYSHKFQLLEADEFTLKYMEKCAKEVWRTQNGTF